MLGQLEQYGLFVVDVGELENWLSYLEVQEKKSAWLVRMFENMGEDPDSEDYVRPTAGDVWDFIGRVKKWLFDPNHRGIP